MGTRTILTKLFDSVDRPSAKNVEESGAAGNLQPNLTAQAFVPASDGLADADRAILRLPLQSLVTPQEMAAWGAAQARAGNLPKAETALEDAIRTDPSNPDIRQLLASVYTVSGKRTAAEQLTKQDSDNELTVLRALYEPRPRGFRKAIEVGERLASMEGTQKSANLHSWLACAYGQKHAYEKSQNADAGTLAATKKRMLEEIQVAISADPAARGVLRATWKPAPGMEDNDLADFPPDDPDLIRLLGD